MHFCTGGFGVFRVWYNYKMQKIALDKVYIVMCNVEHEAEYLERIFTNEESAKQYCLHKEQSAGKWDTFYVREEELFD